MRINVGGYLEDISEAFFFAIKREIVNPLLSSDVTENAEYGRMLDKIVESFYKGFAVVNRIQKAEDVTLSLVYDLLSVSMEDNDYIDDLSGAYEAYLRMAEDIDGTNVDDVLGRGNNNISGMINRPLSVIEYLVHDMYLVAKYFNHPLAKTAYQEMENFRDLFVEFTDVYSRLATDMDELFVDSSYYIRVDNSMLSLNQNIILMLKNIRPFEV